MSNLNLNTISSLVTGREVGVNRVMQTVDYVGGLVIDSLDTVIVDGDDRYVLTASTALPYTTTGAGMPEGGAFVSVGDAKLRQDLLLISGTELIGYPGFLNLKQVLDRSLGDRVNLSYLGGTFSDLVDAINNGISVYVDDGLELTVGADVTISDAIIDVVFGSGSKLIIPNSHAVVFLSCSGNIVNLNYESNGRGTALQFLKCSKLTGFNFSFFGSRTTPVQIRDSFMTVIDNGSFKGDVSSGESGRFFSCSVVDSVLSGFVRCNTEHSEQALVIIGSGYKDRSIPQVGPLEFGEYMMFIDLCVTQKHNRHGLNINGSAVGKISRSVAFPETGSIFSAIQSKNSTNVAGENQYGTSRNVIEDCVVINGFLGSQSTSFSEFNRVNVFLFDFVRPDLSIFRTNGTNHAKFKNCGLIVSGNCVIDHIASNSNTSTRDYFEVSVTSRGLATLSMVSAFKIEGSASNVADLSVRGDDLTVTSTSDVAVEVEANNVGVNIRKSDATSVGANKVVSSSGDNLRYVKYPLVKSSVLIPDKYSPISGNSAAEIYGLQIKSLTDPSPRATQAQIGTVSGGIGSIGIFTVQGRNSIIFETLQPPVSTALYDSLRIDTTDTVPVMVTLFGFYA